MKTTAVSIVLLVVIVSAVLFAGRGTADDAAEFTFVDRADIITLDLNQMSYMQDFRLTYAFREGLFSLKPVTFEPIPAGCESFDVSPDARVYTFKLRQACKWSNGDPVTAHDYVFSWLRMLEEPGDYTSLFYYIKNADAYEKAFKERKPFDMKSLGIEAIDDYTLRLTLADPVAYLKDLLAFPPFYPRHERSMAKFRTFGAGRDVVNEVAQKAGATTSTMTGREICDLLAKADAAQPYGPPAATPSDAPFDERSKADQLHFMASERRVMAEFDPKYTRPPDVVTNGPFTIDTWQFKSRIRLNRSDTYWDKANVKLASVEMRVNAKALSQFLQYENGSVDWLAECPPDFAPDLFEQKRSDLRRANAFGTAFLSLLTTENFPPEVLGGAKNPMADVRVRQALAMSIDKSFIVENVTRMGEGVATTYFPPGTLRGFEPKPGLPFDPERARKLLADAGYPDGQGFPQLPVIYAAENSTRTKIVQYAASQWRKHLNIQVDLQSVDGATFSQRMTDRTYAIGPIGWFGDYPDVSTFTDKYLTTSINNNSAWSVKEYDDLCAAAAKEPDPAKRLILLGQAEEMVDQQVPIIPLYHNVNVSLYRDGITGIEPNARNLIVWKAVEVKR